MHALKFDVWSIDQTVLVFSFFFSLAFACVVDKYKIIIVVAIMIARLHQILINRSSVCIVVDVDRFIKIYFDIT